MVANSYHFDADLDQHECENSDPDPHLSENNNPDQHNSDADPQLCPWYNIFRNRITYN